MIRRFCIICCVIGAALLMLSILGFYSLKTHERGLRAERMGQFVAVAEQIRLDVKSRLDEFLQAEQRRPYTDYLYAYVPDSPDGDSTLVRSPLADAMTHGLAYGHFQIDPQGNIVTPYAPASADSSQLPPELAAYFQTLRTGVLDSLRGQRALRLDRFGTPAVMRSPAMALETEKKEDVLRRTDTAEPIADRQTTLPEKSQVASEESQAAQRIAGNTQTYSIDSLQQAQRPQTLQQARETATRNVGMTAAGSELPAAARVAQEVPAQANMEIPTDSPSPTVQQERIAAPRTMAARRRGLAQQPASDEVNTVSAVSKAQAEPMVQIRIEPFVPLIVPADKNSDSVFPDAVFLVRHVQIEDIHLLQGFRLNTDELVRQVQQSARKLLREGMAFELSRTPRPDAAHTAILDFGFGYVTLNLLEMEPGWITDQSSRLKTWLVWILAVVWLAVILAMVGLWRNLREQAHLARKKDDFISAVSHELRTPLTSIRMYTEMLEKDWVKQESRKREYYGTMRQESERLSRLIENVLDFSRLQRGKKQFDFAIGNINDCVRDVVEMMRPYVERNGFVLVTELRDIEPFAFDRDAVMQIVINLIDNALKYAKDAQDKQIIVRCRSQKHSAVIEVEDHGPGIPKSQQKRIFEAFYRCGDEATRQANGTGLGLALVKRFAQAHRGLVEVLNAKPSGVIFRVHLAR